ncbi:hypothetical protein [Streptomyces sp. NPDC058861]|uniref:hypothetical protein n=1 Tax=Streptomyces sp. NPDC058861 TaxID=3346653 RepID=UPI00367A99B1
MNEFVKNHGVRLFAAVAALTPFLVTRFPEVPWEALAAIAAALLGVGEVAQRTEDRKTTDAFLAQSPWDRAAEHQVELAAIEAERKAGL